MLHKFSVVVTSKRDNKMKTIQWIISFSQQTVCYTKKAKIRTDEDVLESDVCVIQNFISLMCTTMCNKKSNNNNSNNIFFMCATKRVREYVIAVQTWPIQCPLFVEKKKIRSWRCWYTHTQKGPKNLQQNSHISHFIL